MKLIIGNKNYSSWSLRAWMFLHAHQVEFSELLESLAQDNLSTQLSQYSGSARVPVLIDADLNIWDSLAICEYVSERYLQGAGWPQELTKRAQARAIVAEMHSGFSALRAELPMNCRARRTVALSESAKRDIARVDQIWSTYASEDELGKLRLFGQFTIADCFFAPLVLRFESYGVGLSSAASAYANSLLAHPSMQVWLADALAEKEVVSEEEVGEELTVS